MNWLAPTASPSGPAEGDPRATLIAGIGEGLRAELWMGGANAAGGSPLSPEDLEGSILVDCAGEAPAPLRAAAARVIPFVFADLEAIPQRYTRLIELTVELARLLHHEAPAAPPRLYVLCQQGMNRSALVTGLTLRAAGFEGKRTLALLRARRPGCLTNQTYAALISGAPCSPAAELSG